MNRTEQKQKNMTKFGVPENRLVVDFPEFFEIKNRFIYGDVREAVKLTDTQKMLVTITALTTVEGGDLAEQIHSALKIGVSPEELQEVFHQVAPYIGFAKAEKGLCVLKEVFGSEGILLPLKAQSAVTEETRLAEGIAAQKLLFGPMIDAMRANAPENQKFMQDYLSAFCFGDTYTRGALDLSTRELLTFAAIICLGGCDSQAKSHASANFMLGNTPEILYAVIAQCLPYIGFPRSLNAMTAIGEVLKMQEKMKSSK